MMSFFKFEAEGLQYLKNNKVWFFQILPIKVSLVNHSDNSMPVCEESFVMSVNKSPF